MRGDLVARLVIEGADVAGTQGVRTTHRRQTLARRAEIGLHGTGQGARQFHDRLLRRLALGGNGVVDGPATEQRDGQQPENHEPGEEYMDRESGAVAHPADCHCSRARSNLSRVLENPLAARCAWSSNGRKIGA